MRPSLRRAAFISTLVGVAVVAGFGAGATFAQEKTEAITGTWKVTGWNPGKPRTGPPQYGGTVEVTRKGDKGCYEVLWKLGSSTQRGIGVYDPKGGVFAVGYTTGGRPGVVLYRPSAKGEGRDGLWSLDGYLEKPPGQERWLR